MEPRKKRYKGDLIDDLVRVHFNWNDDLGVLQQRTKANLESIGNLYTNDVISYGEYVMLKEEIVKYYREGLQEALSATYTSSSLI